MPVRRTLSVHDLQLLRRITDRRRPCEDDDVVPRAVLRDLAELLPCDAVRIVIDVPDLVESRNELAVPLGAMAGGRGSWIVFSHEDGRPFSALESLLVGLLRPHLAEMCEYRARCRQERLHPLTQRQLQLVRMVASGETNRQIARHAGIAEGTVRKHLENAYARLGVGNRFAAVERAFGQVSAASATELFDAGHAVRPGNGGRVRAAAGHDDRPAVEDQWRI
jgi:DNA-binding CsgD family transcriptional regulator